MSPTLSQPVIVSGAGIGGLTLAICLQRKGIPVRVLERTACIAPVGAGLMLQPNGMAVMKSIGLLDAVVAAGNIMDRMAILNQQGSVLGSERKVKMLTRSYGVPMVAIHRARLHAVLLSSLEPGVLELNREIAGYEARGESVEVQCSDGSTLTTGLLVGADGLKSKIRERMFGKAEPVYAGYTSWRGITVAGKGPRLERMSESWGRGERFGMADVGHGEIYWFAVADASAGGRDQDVHAELCARFRNWHAPVQAVLEATPPDRILRTDIADRDPIPCWHDGRVVLLGDAAHPMTPNLGQGACQAIEDAYVLADALVANSMIDDAIRVYEQRRASRANGIVRASRQLGSIAHWSNPLAVILRNGLMRATPARVADQQIQSLWALPEA